ncbi:MAG: alcohol dehydrogenase catalytic domain-containing protein [Planctomycetaceae bacterium]|nr:alcohol dehydrogenase catalytic domain-containing protein [Planctomycetaceae bacterium]
MRAIVYYAPGDIRVEDVPQPVCYVDGLLVRVEACAVCGTDLKSKLSGNPRINAPLVMGHEFTGVIEQFGSDVIRNGGVSDLQLGDRIVMATSVSCGKCFYCKLGYRNLCSDLAPMGFSYPGGMAEYVAIPGRALREGHVIKVPASVSAIHAALAEPISCAVNSVSQCDIKSGDTVLVMGAGPMGLLNAVVARASGAQKVLLSELNELRRMQAAQFGIDKLIDPANESLADIVKTETNGIGADVVIVAAPAAPPQEEALSLVRKRGTVCLFASLPVGKSELKIDSRLIHYGEIRLIGSSDSTPQHVEKAVELIASGTIPVERIASHTLPLEKIEEAFTLMQRGESLRVVLVP